MKTQTKTVHANNTTAAIRSLLKGAKPVSAQEVEEGHRGAYDIWCDAEVIVEWDNGIVTRHADEWCGKSNSIEGECYRPHIEVLGYQMIDGHGRTTDDVTSRLENFGPNEVERFRRVTENATPCERDESDY